jgi:hypothetical protein
VNAGVEFSANAVLRHAGVVDAASEAMAQARAAAGQVAMNTHAYGQLCQFLPALLSPLLGNAAEVLSEAVDSLSETALKLRATAAEMDGTDAANARRINGAGSGLELPL